MYRIDVEHDNASCSWSYTTVSVVDFSEFDGLWCAICLRQCNMHTCTNTLCSYIVICNVMVQDSVCWSCVPMGHPLGF
jgi:hypothetical protein